MNDRIQEEEISQAKARVAIGIVVLFAIVGIFYFQKINAITVLFVLICFVFTALWLLFVRRYPGDYLWRRRVMSLFDIGTVSVALYLSGEWGAIFYFLYLWIIVGNGMRFGSRTLMEVMVLGVIGYSFVLMNSEYWLDNMPTGGGLLLGLIILPSFYMVLIKRLHALNDKLNLELEKTTYAATHDGMTNLLNREYFFQRVTERVYEAKRYGEHFAIVFIDLDGFKEINDTYGHHYGDELLKTTAARIQQTVRKCDLVARLGGDEFAVILQEINDDQINIFAKRLLDQIEKDILIENCDARITASVGISLFPEHGELADALVKAADTAMYQSKNSGKNRFTIMHINKPKINVSVCR